MSKLPDKLSELILVALEDLEKVEAMPDKYTVEMGAWHEPRGPVCEVCFAGSVMAMSLEDSPLNNSLPYEFGKTISDKLTALDWVRTGSIRRAIQWMLIPLPSWAEFPFDYGSLALMSEDPKTRPQWKLHMQDIAGILAAEGL